MTIHGIDISRWQRGANLAVAADAGVKFVYIKLSEGATYLSPTAETQARQCHEAGIKFGFYHYCYPQAHKDPRKDARGEAEWFAEQAEKISYVPALPMAVDWEHGANEPGKNGIADMSRMAKGTWLGAFVERITQLGWQHILYGGAKVIADSWTHYDGDLWVARYPKDRSDSDHQIPWNVGPPTLPPAINHQKPANARVVLWQWTAQAGVPGIQGDCDRNVVIDHQWYETAQARPLNLALPPAASTTTTTTTTAPKPGTTADLVKAARQHHKALGDILKQLDNKTGD